MYLLVVYIFLFLSSTLLRKSSIIFSSLVDGHLDYFQVWQFWVKLLKTFIHIEDFLWIYVFISLSPRVTCFILYEAQTVAKMTAILHPHWHCLLFPVVAHLPSQHLLQSLFVF